ncbi:MAG: TA system VapC family ribonuclease toxin [Acidimicrobiales bacterium]
MRALLDINVLLALLDRDHLEHGRARSWLEAEVAHGWASCPITENGFVRVISQPRYPNPITPAAAISLMRSATEQPQHQFWACDVSVLDPSALDQSRLHGPRQVTDAYLLALATKRGGRFVTFDQSVSLAVAKGATADNLAVV